MYKKKATIAISTFYLYTTFMYFIFLILCITFQKNRRKRIAITRCRKQNNRSLIPLFRHISSTLSLSLGTLSLSLSLSPLI
jgi:hypothetical protein